MEVRDLDGAGADDLELGLLPGHRVLEVDGLLAVQAGVERRTSSSAGSSGSRGSSRAASPGSRRRRSCACGPARRPSCRGCSPGPCPPRPAVWLAPSTLKLAVVNSIRGSVRVRAARGARRQARGAGGPAPRRSRSRRRTGRHRGRVRRSARRAPDGRRDARRERGGTGGRDRDVTRASKDRAKARWCAANRRTTPRTAAYGGQPSGGAGSCARGPGPRRRPAGGRWRGPRSDAVDDPVAAEGHLVGAEDPVDLHRRRRGAAATGAAAVGGLEGGVGGQRAEVLGALVEVAGEEDRVARAGQLVGQRDLPAGRRAPPPGVVAVVLGARRVVEVRDPELLAGERCAAAGRRASAAPCHRSTGSPPSPSAPR